MSRRVEFEVRGKPQPQGSTRTFMVKGRAVTTSANPNLKDWRTLVAFLAQDAMDGGGLLEGPVHVRAIFDLPRPKSRPKKNRFPDRRPDVDKLARALLDGITNVVFADDAQVCELHVEKRYADPGLSPRVYVAAYEMNR